MTRAVESFSTLSLNINNRRWSYHIHIYFMLFMGMPKKKYKYINKWCFLLFLSRCRYWSLKEAYVKAIGSGMAYGLEQVEFHHIGWNEIQVKVGGEILKEWRFWISELGNGHCVSFTLYVFLVKPFDV